MAAESWILIGAALTLAALNIGLFSWLRGDMKAGLRQLDERLGAVERDVGRVENEVAFMRGQLSLALPALAQPRPPPAPEPGTG